jgi:high-affinity iron transporter
VGAGFVALREGFEAALVVVIVLAFLNRTGKKVDVRPVWIGAGAAVALTVVTALGLVVVGAELEGTSEAVFEGATMIIAAALLTWMIFWMRKHSRGLKAELEGKAGTALAAGSGFALAGVAFLAVIREGLETALFLLSTT